MKYRFHLWWEESARCIILELDFIHVEPREIGPQFVANVRFAVKEKWGKIRSKHAPPPIFRSLIRETALGQKFGDRVKSAMSWNRLGRVGNLPPSMCHLK